MAQCITLSYGNVKGAAKRYPYWQGALYETRHNRNGVLIWSYICHVGTARRSKSKAECDIREYSKACKVIHLDGIRNNNPVDLTLDLEYVTL